MKGLIYRCMVVLLATMATWSATAQEIVTDQLVYDRITGYMTTDSNVEVLPTNESKNLQTIRWKHDINIWYGAPGLISEFMLDNIVIGDADYLETSLTGRLKNIREVTSPLRKLSTLGIGYSQQLRPWLAIGCKATFAAIWQYEYDLMTNEPLYDNNCYTTSALLDARFSWLRRTNIEMYSSIGLGLFARIERANGGLCPIFDAALVGLKIGREFYGFMEIGAGAGGSVRGGIGIRFNGKN